MADLGTIGASYGVGSERATDPVGRTLVYSRPSGVATAAPGASLASRQANPRPGPSNITVPGTPSWYGSPRPIGADPQAVYAVGGTVKQRLNGVDSPLVGCMIRLYARRTGMPVGAATSAADGSFLVPGLLPETRGFFAVAFDPDGEPVQNALVFDRLMALPGVPGEIRYESIVLTQGISVSYALRAVYVEGTITWSVSAGALPAGMSLNPSTGVLSGAPTDTGPYSFTVSAVGSAYNSASRSWSGEVAGGLEYRKTLNGTIGLTLVRTGQQDEGYIVVPALPFQFSLFGTLYQNNIYVCANSYVTFGFGASVYSGLSPTNPGRGILLGAADRSWRALYAGSILDGQGYLIRFEGSTTYTTDDGTNIWELAFYVDGTIGLVTGPFPADGITNVSDGTAWRTTGGMAIQPNKAYLGTPTGTGGNYVWEENT
ncbi:tail fiber protein [Stenotrophomonas phage vB_SmaS-AXL_1]|uniref:tail fiber protein n=1 Tax=Stenotrophomonas phage vB_SmaS-AXL_1 TaxID=2909581 RepID=UPI002409ED26|nr:tail fiber protein [Stenotrophomonas phage vB_SmaS-AXL_1]UIS24737.1 tail fiber protein [Stenotrophomonas phage vB_SmaS-AXL_1]